MGRYEERFTTSKPPFGRPWPRHPERVPSSPAGPDPQAERAIRENLNSRLRSYFFLRRHLGDEYLDLLRFFLNHHRFMRSDRPERVGKSPAELLSGEAQSHWIELLGFETSHRN